MGKSFVRLPATGSLEQRHETARVHHAVRRRGGDVAARRAGAAADAVIGLLSSVTARQWAPFVSAFLQGLNELGFIEGQNVVAEQRWAGGQYERLPAMAADLIQRQVAVIAALTTPAAVAAKAATATTPIVFTTIGDPVQIGLVPSPEPSKRQYDRCDLFERGSGPETVGIAA